MSLVVRDLVRPERFLVENIASEAGDAQRVILEPLDHGFGHTLGAALRRVLLSSLEGWAAVSMKIRGISHEFAGIPGVREDVQDVILSVKSLRFRSLVPQKQMGVQKLVLEVSGEGPVKASSLKGTDLEVINGDLVLFHLDSCQSVYMEIFVQRSFGYRVDHLDSEEFSQDEIKIDAFFSPVRRVAYSVDKVRVGDRTDYDRLVMDIVTDGSLKGEDALKEAIGIFQSQFSLFHQTTQDSLSSLNAESSVGSSQSSLSGGDLSKILSQKIEDLDLDPRVIKALKYVNVVYVADLIKPCSQDIFSYYS